MQNTNTTKKQLKTTRKQQHFVEERSRADRGRSRSGRGRVEGAFFLLFTIVVNFHDFQGFHDLTAFLIISLFFLYNFVKVTLDKTKFGQGAVKEGQGRSRVGFPLASFCTKTFFGLDMLSIHSPCA